MTSKIDEFEKFMEDNIVCFHCSQNIKSNTSLCANCVGKSWCLCDISCCKDLCSNFSTRIDGLCDKCRTKK